MDNPATTSHGQEDPQVRGGQDSPIEPGTPLKASCPELSDILKEIQYLGEDLNKNHFKLIEILKGPLKIEHTEDLTRSEERFYPRLTGTIFPSRFPDFNGFWEGISPDHDTFLSWLKSQPQHPILSAPKVRLDNIVTPHINIPNNWEFNAEHLVATAQLNFYNWLTQEHWMSKSIPGCWRRAVYPLNYSMLITS
jgi:hypothetical protein